MGKVHQASVRKTWGDLEMKHLQDYITIHRQNPRYGPGPTGRVVDEMAREFDGISPLRAIDWGCGNSRVLRVLFPLAECKFYDPAIPRIDMPPVGIYDVGICTDVMEHIPEDEIDGTLDRMAKVCGDWLFIIDNKVALQLLPDGSNAHVSQHDADWWAHRLRKVFPQVKTWRCDSTRFYARCLTV